MISDPDATLVQALLDITSLEALFSSRIYGGVELPNSYSIEQGPALLGSVRAGSYDNDAAVVKANVVFRIYGKTTAEVREAEAALHQGFDGHKSPGVIFASQNQVGQVFHDPQTGWPVSLAIYQIFLSNK